MSDLDALPTDDCLDALVTQLISCGGPLSQMISHMHEAEASGLSVPDPPETRWMTRGRGSAGPGKRRRRR